MEEEKDLDAEVTSKSFRGSRRPEAVRVSGRSRAILIALPRQDRTKRSRRIREAGAAFLAKPSIPGGARPGDARRGERVVPSRRDAAVFVSRGFPSAHFAPSRASSRASPERASRERRDGSPEARARSASRALGVPIRSRTPSARLF